MKDPAQAAYEVYRNMESPAAPPHLPEWHQLHAYGKEMWEAVAYAALAAVRDNEMEEFVSRGLK